MTFSVFADDDSCLFATNPDTDQDGVKNEYCQQKEKSEGCPPVITYKYKLKEGKDNWPDIYNPYQNANAGDFDYNDDGVVDGADSIMIRNAVNTQGGLLDEESPYYDYLVAFDHTGEGFLSYGDWCSFIVLSGFSKNPDSIANCKLRFWYL